MSQNKASIRAKEYAERRKMLMESKKRKRETESSTSTTISTAQETKEPATKKRFLDEEGQEVIPNLYIGPSFAASNQEWLDEHKITHMVSVTKGKQIPLPEKYQCYTAEIDDTLDEDILRYLDSGELFDFIDRGINDGVVMVYCIMGISRSATVVIAYLMKKMNISFDEAHALVFKARSIILPNENFVKQLKAYKCMNFTLTGDTQNHIHYRLSNTLRDDYHPEDSDVECKEEFKLLKSIDFSNTRPKEFHFHWLTQIPHLETLDLSNTRITDSVGPLLTQLSTLRKLNLSGTYLSDDQFASLTCLPTLENITLSVDQSDASLQILAAKCPSLTELHLAKACINELITTLKREDAICNLRVLDTGNVPVKTKALIEVVALRPNLQFVTGDRFVGTETEAKTLKEQLQSRSAQEQQTTPEENEKECESSVKTANPQNEGKQEAK